MGLDAVEIILAVEEKFGIAIPDEEAEKIATPGDMTDYVFHKVQHPDKSRCLSQRAFHLLRRAWMTSLHTPRNLFRLDTQVDDIVPRENRKHLWADSGREVGAMSWPDLERSQAPVGVLGTLTIATFVGMYLLGAHAMGWGSGLPILAAVCICVLQVWGMTVVTRPLKTVIPSRFRKIEDLVEYVVARSPELLKVEERKWTREEVWLVVREIVIEQTGVHDFTEKSHFVKDYRYQLVPACAGGASAALSAVCANTGG